MQGSEKRATAGAANTGGAAGERTRDVFARSYRTADRDGRQGPKHGRLDGNTWTKTVRASSHMLRVPKGWALDVADLDRAEASGALAVHLHDLEQLAHYWATVAAVRARGFAFDRGHGKQIALALEYWCPTRQEAEAQNAPGDDAEQPKVVQLGLFGRKAAA